MPAGGDTYTIKANFVVDDKSARGIGTASRGVARLESQVAQAGLRMSAAFGAAVATLGGGIAFGAATRGIIRMGSEVDNAEASLATLFNTVTGTPIERAMGVARQSLAGLRKDAALGAGDLQDYIQGFRGIADPVLSSGGTTDIARELTRNAIGAGFALDGEQGIEGATTDVQQALESGAGANTPIVNAALEGVKSLSAFNKLDVVDRVEVLNKAFGKFAPGVDLMGKTWDAQMSTMKDNLAEVLRTVSRPIYDRWKGSLMRANEWLEKNKDLVDEIATEGGQRLLKMWNSLIKNARTYATIVAGASLGKGVGAVAGAAGIGASGVGAIGVAAVSVAVVAAAFAVSGALAEWPALMVVITGSIDSLMESLIPLGDAFGRLTAEGSAFNIVGAGIILVFGGLMSNLVFFVDGLTLAIDAFGTFIRIVGVGVRSLVLQANALAQGNLSGQGKISQRSNAKINALAQGFLDRNIAGAGASDEFEEGLRSYFDNKGKGGADGLDKVATSPNGDVNINGPITIKQKVEQNADPARVLSSWRDVLERTIRFKDGAAPERR